MRARERDLHSLSDFREGGSNPALRLTNGPRSTLRLRCGFPQIVSQIFALWVGRGIWRVSRFIAVGRSWNWGVEAVCVNVLRWCPAAAPWEIKKHWVVESERASERVFSFLFWGPS